MLRVTHKLAVCQKIISISGGKAVNAVPELVGTENQAEIFLRLSSDRFQSLYSKQNRRRGALVVDSPPAVRNIDSYVGTADFYHANGTPDLGILCHLDVVPEGSGRRKVFIGILEISIAFFKVSYSDNLSFTD